MVMKGLRFPPTIRVASRIVSGVVPNTLQMAGAIRGWLDSRVTFQPDPHGIETLREVHEMFRDISELGNAQIDCDDISILGATLGKAVGLPARFTVLAFPPHNNFQHVYTELNTGRGWLDLDITKPPSPMPPTRVMHLRV